MYPNEDISKTAIQLGKGPIKSLSMIYYNMEKTMSKRKIYILCGNIGTGKTRFCKQMVQKEDALIVSNDGIINLISAEEYTFNVMRHTFMKSVFNSIIKLWGGEMDLEGHDIKYGYPDRNLIIDTTAINKFKREMLIGTLYTHLPKKVFDNTDLICVDFGPGTYLSLERRKVNPRNQSKETWESVHKKFQEEYQKPTLDEGFLEIIDMTAEFKNE